MKRTKFFLSLYLTLILLFSLSPSVNATNSAPIYTNTKKIFEINEYKEVITAVSNAGLLQDAQAEKKVTSGILAEDAGYKLFTLSSPDFLKSLQKKDPISSFITNEYVWVVSAQDKMVKVNDKGGEWSVIGYSESGSDLLSTTALSGMIDLSSVNSLLSAKAGDGADVTGATVCFDAPMYHTSFVLCDIGGSEYLIPYGTRPDLTGLENGTLYSRQQVTDILSENFGTSYSGDHNTGGGSSHKPMKVILLVLFGISSLMLCIAFLMLLFKKRLKRT